jgi:hypothetical protein
LRRLGDDASRCVAALGPFLGSGTTETARFLQGAGRRNETAVAFWELGDAHRVGFSPDAGWSLTAERLPAGARLDLTEGLSDVDRDLALRVRNALPDDAILHSLTVEMGPPLQPLLEDGLGNPVVAVWADPDRRARWHVVPRGIGWEGVVEWLFDRGIRQYVPAVASRIPALAKLADNLLTSAERAARLNLERLEEEFNERRAALDSAMAKAREEADVIRKPLLWGTGDDLKQAVAALLGPSGFEVEDLDQTFGSGRSGDLLVSKDAQHRLVETKGLTGAPSEREVGDVVKHVRTWPSLGRAEELNGGVLVLNHHLRVPPLARPRSPYQRPEFVDALNGFGVTVIDSIALARWWAADQLDEVARAVTGPCRQYGVTDSED